MLADLKEQVSGLWRARNPRERMALQAAGLVLFVGIFYGLVYAPLDAARGKLSDRLQRLRAEHRLMEAQVNEVVRSRRSDYSPARSIDVSLLKRVESSARAQGFQGKDVSITSAGGDLVQVVAPEQPVRIWLEWLVELQRQGIVIRNVRMRMSGADDLASIEVSLAGEAP